MFFFFFFLFIFLSLVSVRELWLRVQFRVSNVLGGFSLLACYLLENDRRLSSGGAVTELRRSVPGKSLKRLEVWSEQGLRTGSAKMRTG